MTTTYINVLLVLFDTHSLLDRDPRTSDRVEVSLVRRMLDGIDRERNGYIDIPTRQETVSLD
jgi:hypothetical protein